MGWFPCAAEGIVLMKNEKNTLPLQENDVVSVFGRCQNDWFYVGYGSGGDVHPPYTVSLMEGLRRNGIRCNEALAKVYADWCKDPENVADHGWWGLVGRQGSRVSMRVARASASLLSSHGRVPGTSPG